MNIQQLRVQIAVLQDATMDENKNFRSAYDEGKFDALSAVDALLDSLQEEPVSEELEEAADNALSDVLNTHEIVNVRSCLEMFRLGSKWQKSNLWKPADGDDLPEIDREVIALLDNGKVVFAHRPPEYWDGKDIVTGKITKNYPKTYDKGGWNIPNIKYWLDVELPKEIEL